MESIRSKYFLDTSNISEDFITKLAVKSSNTEDDTRKLLKLIKHLKDKSTHTEEDLLNLNKKIEAFRI